MDFATAVGQQTGGFGDDNTAQVIANQLAQPQVGMNRSNVRGMANYDPTFAAAFDISRGLDPTNNMGGTGGLAVPSYLRPQTPGNLVLNEAGDRMMYGSPVERFAQETAPEFVRGIQKVGIGGLLNTISEAFSDAKRAIGLDGGAQGGLKAEDLQPTMGTLDPSDRFLGDMSQQGADIRVTDPVVSAPASVNMASVPQVSPMFDQFGNPYRSGFDRNMAEMAQQSLSGGIASVAPNQAQEVGDAMRDTFVTTTPNLNLPGFRSKSMSKEEADRVKENLEKNNPAYQQMSDASTFNILQGLGTKFNPEVNRFLQQNISPNLRFDTSPRRDPYDPDKLMPFMGLEYRFTA